LDIGAKEEDEQRDDERAQGVEEEAGQRFEAEDASSNAEEGGSQGADVGDSLQRGSVEEVIGCGQVRGGLLCSCASCSPARQG
jgi:hypothetical protein